MEQALHRLGCRESLSPTLVAHVIDPHLLHHHSLALGFFDWSSQQPGFSHDSSSYQSILKALSLSRKFNAVDRVLKQSKSQKVNLPPYVYRAVIASQITSKNTRTAFSTFKEVGSLISDIGPQTCNSLLAATSSEGDLSRARNVFDEMTLKGVRLNTHGFGVFVWKFCRCNGLEMTLNLLDEARRIDFSGINGSVIAVLVVHGLCSGSFVSEAVVALDELRKRDCKPDFIAYRVVAEALREMGNVVDVERVLKRKRKLGPNLEEIPNWRSGETSEAAEAFHRPRRVDDLEMYETGDERSQERTMKQFQNSTIQYANEMGLQRPVRIPDWRNGEARKAEVSQRGRRIGIDGSMYAVSNNSADASSSYQVGSSYGYQQPRRSGNSEESSSSGFAKTEYSEDERAELLRKLDELKEQLSRPCEVIDNPKDTFPLDRKIVNQDPYGDSRDWFPDGTSRIVNRGSMQYPVSNQGAIRPPLLNHYQEPSPVLGRHEMPGHGFYPPGHTSSHPRLFGDPLRSQRLRTDPYQTTPAQFQQHPSHPHIAGHYSNNEIIDHLQPYAPHVNRHHPSCTCFHCYKTNQNLVQALPTTFGDSRFSNVPSNPIFYHHENPGRFGPPDYDPRIPSALPLKTQNPQSQRRWPGDLNSDVGVLVRRRPPGLQPPSSGHRCRPIAGGAPFLTCHNCLELLHLPKRAFIRDRKQRKMKCGACSSTMVFAVANKRLISVHEQVKKNAEMFTTDDNLTQESSYSHGHINQPSTIFSSEDFDNSRYDFHAMDEEHRSLSTGQASSVKSMEVRSHRSKSSSMSAEEGNLVASAASAINSNPVELPMKDKVSPPPAGSPLQDHFDYSTKYSTANRFENGNLSGRSSPDKMMSKKNASRQTSMKDVSVATEMDISSNEYANTGSSLELGESSKGDRLNSNKTTESFFAGIAKRSFKSKHVVGEERGNVTVNGNLIPDQLIKKAERVAGKINPGHYWYDFRAGFWGVMGGPCLGIVPPFIEEFNYPMPENCAGGNTGVFVNGRELHNKDLQLLCSRGLSSERDRSYIVEISGRVLDEDTGEELESLGKLAPTVERMKRGFGMKVPKRAA